LTITAWSFVTTNALCAHNRTQIIEQHKVFVDNSNMERSDSFQDTNFANKNEIDLMLYKASVNLVKHKEVGYNVNGI
tara:strand:+ start:376 stop:606 length:231 start_codon:yes stop_codon:yes gene_type:complete